MPQILPEHVPMPRCVIGWDGARYRAFAVDAAGHVQVDVVASGLPAGAATEATLASADAYLALIALIRNALQSVDTDRLIVRGEDQLFSFKGVLSQKDDAVISGANGYSESGVVPAGEVWCVTTIAAYDRTSATTRHVYVTRRNGVVLAIGENIAALAADKPSFWSGWTWLDTDDRIRVYFTGGLVGDNCRIETQGYKMTKET